MYFNWATKIVNETGPSGHAIKGVGLYRLDAEIVGSNPFKAWILSLSFSCVVLCRQRPMRQADDSSKGVLPNSLRGSSPRT